MLNGNGSVDTSTHRVVRVEPPLQRAGARVVAVIEHRPGGSRITGQPPAPPRRAKQPPR